jgi:integrase
VSGGRPRTTIGTFGCIALAEVPGGWTASARVRDEDGRLRRVKATAASKGVATQLLKERIRDRPSQAGRLEFGVRTSFCDLVARWLAWNETRDLAPKTKAWYAELVASRLLPALGELTLGEITTARVEAFLQAEYSQGWQRAKTDRTMLNQVFKFAMRHDALQRNPVDATSPLKSPKGSPQALTWEQVEAIRGAASRHRTGEGLSGPKPDGVVRDFIEVLLGTALRPGEALALRRGDVTDRPRGMTLRVTGTIVPRKGEGWVRQDHPKTEASIREIAVPEFAAALLRERMAGLGQEDLIFRNRDGGAYSQHNLRRTFREYLELAGLADSGISFRWYRRTGATVLARAVSVDAASAFLGHTSTAITEGYYVEPSKVVDVTPAAALDRILRPGATDHTVLTTPLSDDEEWAIDSIIENVGDAA